MLRLVVCARDDAGGGSGRRVERPRLDAQRAAFPGTETRGLLKLGRRYTRGTLRVDAGIYFGLTTIDPTIGFTTGFTYVFNAFTLP